MAWNQDANASKRGNGHGNPLAQLDVGMKHDLRGRRDAPLDIHFIVVGCMGSDRRTLSRQHLVYMNMHGRRRDLVFEFFRVNMVEWRL